MQNEFTTKIVIVFKALTRTLPALRQEINQIDNKIRWAELAKVLGEIVQTSQPDQDGNISRRNMLEDAYHLRGTWLVKLESFLKSKNGRILNPRPGGAS